MYRERKIAPSARMPEFPRTKCLSTLVRVGRSSGAFHALNVTLFIPPSLTAGRLRTRRGLFFPLPFLLLLLIRRRILHQAPVLHLRRSYPPLPHVDRRPSSRPLVRHFFPVLSTPTGLGDDNQGLEMAVELCDEFSVG